MAQLTRVLSDYDEDILLGIAGSWGEGFTPIPDRLARAEKLAGAITTPEAVLRMWQTLGAEEQEALQRLLANQGALAAGQFHKLYGELRPMGRARREREQPWASPANVTESLYYKGLIARVFTQGAAGAQATITIPDDFKPYLPEPPAELTAQPAGQPSEVPLSLLEGGPTAPDDMASLLGGLLAEYIDAAGVLEDQPPPAALDALLRRRGKPAYQAMLISLAYDLGLLERRGSGRKVRARLNKAAVQPWLEAPRTNQTRSLAEAWLRSTRFNEALAFNSSSRTGGITQARRALLEGLRGVAVGTWWRTESLMTHLRDQGVAEPADLRLILEGPLCWLGLAEAGESAFRLTAYGVALLGKGEWPFAPDPRLPVHVSPQADVLIPAAVSRYVRFQVMRFSTFDAAPPPPRIEPAAAPGAGRDQGAYRFRLTHTSLTQASAAGLSAGGNIVPFLRRHTGGKLPANVEAMLHGWQAAPGAVRVQEVVVIAARSAEAYEQLVAEPRVRARLGRRIGEFAHLVRRRDLTAVLAALHEAGILPHILAEDEDAGA